MNKKIARLIRLLRDQEITLALAESMTCGQAAHLLSSYPNVSEVLTGSVVCYAPEVKRKVLHVPQYVIDHYTCESREVTEYLVRGLSRVFPGTLFAAITGLAAPGGSESSRKPVGTVFISVLYRGRLRNYRKVFRGKPSEIKKKACMELFGIVEETIIQRDRVNGKK